MVDMIRKKRDGLPLTAAEIEFFVDQYLDERVSDYQVAALLMAIYFQGMNEHETVALTRVMRDSGVVLDFSHVPAPKADKHSTGGVGDKVSLILAPLMAVAGVHVPMISGRNLAHTGGTLDKLDSIPGFQTQLSLPRFRELTERVGACLIGQTEEICPADRRIYALRDATATVPSMPLICASILSKKLAEGIDALVLDVKVGGGAIFPDRKSAEELARRLIRTASHFDLKTTALLTDMSQPLGNKVGNWLEVCEAVEVLRGGGPADVRKVTLALAAAMMESTGRARSLQDGAHHLSKLLDNGRAWEKFLEIVAAQNGDTSALENPSLYSPPKFTLTVPAPQSGYVSHIDARGLGQLCMAIGAGRQGLNEAVDYLAGCTLHKKVGDPVAPGEPLATLQSSKVPLSETQEEMVQQFFQIVDHPAARPALLIAMLDETGHRDVPEI